jgi:hypothetical protein
MSVLHQPPKIKDLKHLKNIVMANLGFETLEKIVTMILQSAAPASEGIETDCQTSIYNVFEGEPVAYEAR